MLMAQAEQSQEGGFDSEEASEEVKDVLLRKKIFDFLADPNATPNQAGIRTISRV